MTNRHSSLPLVYGTKPYNYQREIVEMTWQKPYWAFFMEMGTGKSKIVVDTIVNLYLAGEVDTVLYIAKKGELSNFQVYELPRHKPAHVECSAYIYEGYARSDHVQKIKHMLSPLPHLRVFSMNIESVRAGKGFDIADAFMKSSRKTMIVVDESTTLKDRRSTQHKAVKALRKRARYIRIMTGTVMPHNPVDVFCQSIVLDKTAMGYGGVTAFKSEFIETKLVTFGARSFHQQIGVKNLDLLRQKMKRFSTVLNKEDCLDLPDRIYQKKVVPLTDEQIEHYQSIVDYAVTTIEGDTVDCLNAISTMIRLYQVVCGQLKTDNGYYRIQNNRISAVANFMEEVLDSQEKIIVWSNYKEASEALYEGLTEALRKRKATGVWLQAGLSISERAELIEKFKTDKNCRLFQGNPQSSGYGLTLTEAHTSAYYSNSDNYEHRLQSEARTHRIGQKHKCLYTDFHTPGTVEDAILDRNVMKSLNRGQIMTSDDFLQMIKLRQDK